MIRLLKCHLRNSILAPDKDAEILELSWIDFARKFTPSNRIEGLKSLSMARPGAYVGLVRDRSGKPSNFVFQAQDLSGDISAVIKGDRTFGSRLIEVYRVLSLDRGQKLQELGVGSHPRR